MSNPNQKQELTFKTPQEEIAYLRELNEKLRKANDSGLSIKVSAKGAVSLYGLGRFPITLYKSQWERLFNKIDDIKTFIKENNSKLTTKPTKEPVEEDAA